MSKEATDNKCSRMMAAIIVLNVIFVFLYAFGEQFYFTGRYVLIGGACIFLITAVISILFNNPASLFLRNINISLCTFIIIAIGLQVSYMLFPQLFPFTIRRSMGYKNINIAENQRIDKLKKDVVEYLPDSPYAKIKPNMTFRIPGDYGPESDFVYEMKTDARGFKNKPEIAKSSQYDIVAVGDSYTEGMGVTTEQTWASLLTDRGVSIYSLGVQGYAPSQMAGAFKTYGVQLNPKIVIIGYLGSIFDRERNFLDNKKELPSAIGRLANEFKRRREFVITAILDELITALMSYKDSFSNKEDPRYMMESEMKKDNKIRVGFMQRYRKEMNLAGSVLTQEMLRSKREWSRTMDALSGVVLDAKRINAKVIVLMFRNRGSIYFERATGSQLPNNYSEHVEADALREFCMNNGAYFLDTEKRFHDYVNRLDENAPSSSYPYLKYDGHPSPKGHEIIADVVYEFLLSKDFNYKVHNRF